MKFRQIYDDLMSSRMAMKQTRINDRKQNKRYYEMHHILPRSFGGSDTDSNLVLLTFKEHFIAHLLLLKESIVLNDSIKTKKMMSALLLMKESSGGRNSIEYSNARLNYWKYYRPEYHHMYGGGKHSEQGKRNISKARKNKFPAKDIITGEKVGSVDRNHPKVLSGEWVHQTKGRAASGEERKKISKRTKGMKNPNAKPKITKEFILDYYSNNREKFLHKNGYFILPIDDFRIVAREQFGYTKVNLGCIIPNRFGNDFLKVINEIHGTNYKRRYDK